MPGCLLRVVLLPIIVAVLYPFFLLRAPLPTLVFPAEGAEVAACITGLFLWWAVISWLDMRQIKAHLTQTRQWELRDGERTVIAGYIEAREATLKAPFSGTPCVGYRYTVTHHSRHSNMKTTEWTDYEGYALVPSIVRGPMRTVSLLAAPDKDLFAEVPARTITGYEEWVRADEFLKTTVFGEMPPGPLAETRTRLTENEPGNFREDKQVQEPPKNLLDYRPEEGSRRLKEGQRTLTEAVVQEGDKVLLAGIYSAEQNGITPDPDSIMRPFRIVYGGEEPLRRKIRNRVIGITVSTVLSFVTAALYFLFFVPRE
jgi:hypothetical protein